MLHCTDILLSLAPYILTTVGLGIQVREALRRMWARHGDLLSLIFAANTQRSGLALPGGAGGTADAWRMFFLHAVAVPPNKFRPPSRMGDGLCVF